MTIEIAAMLDPRLVGRGWSLRASLLSLVAERCCHEVAEVAAVGDEEEGEGSRQRALCALWGAIHVEGRAGGDVCGRVGLRILRGQALARAQGGGLMGRHAFIVDPTSLSASAGRQLAGHL